MADYAADWDDWYHRSDLLIAEARSAVYQLMSSPVKLALRAGYPQGT